MVNKMLKSAGQEVLGLTFVDKNPADDSYLYGVYGGYLLSLYDSGNKHTVFLNYYLNETEEDDSVLLLELSESMKAALSEIEVADYEVTVSGARFTLNCNVEEFLGSIDKLIEVAVEKGLVGVSHCSLCGNKIGKRLPKKLTKGKDNYLTCEHCALEELENSRHVETNSSELPKKTALGFLGAVCGGLLGIALYFLFYYFLAPLFPTNSFEVRYVFCLLGFAVAFLVYEGFRLFSKRPCKSASIIISIVTLLSVCTGQYLGVFVQYTKTQGFSISEAANIPSMWLIHLRSTLDSSITYSEDVLALYDISGTFYRLLCFSILFAAIGVALFIMSMYEKNKVKVEPIEIETLRITPIPSAETPEE